MFLFRFRLLFTLLLLIVLFGCTDNKSVMNPLTPIPGGGTNRVTVNDDFFQPANLTVPMGTTVQWDVRGYNQHTVTNGVPGQSNAGNQFDSGTLNRGRSYQVTFNQAGTIQYFCRFHGSMGMTGTITVR
jgi:plastocyanin